MENQIIIREAVTDTEISRFWEQLYLYFKRDILAGKQLEDLDYFLGSAYHENMMMLHSRTQDRCCFLFFRRKGIARMLAQAAQNWSTENSLVSLTVTCAPCDEGMYQALGFDERLGSTFAHIL